MNIKNRKMIINRFILSLVFLTALYASDDCSHIHKAYILGDYQKCSEYTKNGSCSYVYAVCNIGSYKYDEARYNLSIMASREPLALISLAELNYLESDYSKARLLSVELNSGLAKKSTQSYEYILSELLLVKSYLDTSDMESVAKRLHMLKTTKVDPLLYAPITPWF